MEKELKVPQDLVREAEELTRAKGIGMDFGEVLKFLLESKQGPKGLVTL